jgi:TolB protein
MKSTKPWWMRTMVYLVTATLLAIGASGCCIPIVQPSSPTSPLSVLPLPETYAGRVAYTSNQAGDYDIYILDLSTQETRRIASSAQRDIDPDWSPSGNRIAFSSARRDPNELDIFIVDVESGDLTQVTSSEGFEVNPAWSPDGQYLAFHGNQTGDFEIYVYELETGKITNVTNTPGIDYHADWSPDNKQLVFASTRVNHSEIWTMNADGSNPKQLTDWPASRQEYPRWSPDGKTILFVSDRDSEEKAIYAIDAEGGEAVQLTPHGVAATTPAWALDGEAFLYSALSTSEGTTDLWIMQLSGGEPIRILSAPGNESYPAWTP